ncbi:hypothetical protein D7V94_04315 [Parablautia intestinalis]|uniref:Uncharacterized protein n=1 Tax=Parablautia intestinalis TaxID=2320100 RepID=A0A3A9AP89_9FIRM|nr:hypothetical protein D7V94_04315 [Parablautia intestinalis]
MDESYFFANGAGQAVRPSVMCAKFQLTKETVRLIFHVSASLYTLKKNFTRLSKGQILPKSAGA